MIIVKQLLNLPNLITTIGLISAIISIHTSALANFSATLMLIIVAGVCDLLDGFVARKLSRSDNEKRFGAELDSLVDVVSFCVAPAYFLYALSQSRGDLNGWILFICLYFILMGISRLAYFNVHGLENNYATENKTAYYHGLPVTYAALFIPLATLLGMWAAPTILPMIVAGTFSIIATLFVLDIRVIKPSGRHYFVLIGIALVSLWACYKTNIV